MVFIGIYIYLGLRFKICPGNELGLSTVLICTYCADLNQLLNLVD